MKHRSCWPVSLGMGIVLAVGGTAIGWAQPPLGNPGIRPAQPRPQGQEQGVARPPAQPMRVQSVTPELKAILDAWERESAKIKVLQGTHYRQEFNKVFQVEKRSKGVFYFEAPDKGRFDIHSVEIKQGQVSQKKDPETQQPYQLASGTDQIWICTGNMVLMMNPTEKEFEKFPIPAEMQGQNIVQSPLPFLFGMKAEDAMRRFELKLFGQNEGAYFIDARPLLQMDSQNYSHARIVLDKETFVPTTVFLLDPPGTLTTQYTFVDVKVNPGRNLIGQFLPFFKDANPFTPDLRGYKEVLPPPDVQPAGNQVPAGNDPRRAANSVPNGFPQQPNRSPVPR